MTERRPPRRIRPLSGLAALAAAILATACGFDSSANGAPLHVIGIDDPVTRRHDIAAAFADLPEGGTRLALCHCPERALELSARGAHLVLSGHTHGGQINVHGITDRLFRSVGKRYFGAGLYPIGGAWLYVSAGIGFSGVRVRAGRGTRAEVAVITLRALDSIGPARSR